MPTRVGAIVPAPGTRAEITPVKDFYRIDIDLFPPSIDGDEWKLPITGMVEQPAQLTLDGFQKGRYGGDLISTTRWTGVPLRTVLAPLHPAASARYASITSKDGFHEASGFWVERGWSETAQVRTTSVVDTVAVRAAYEKEGRKLVPIGGIAYAGARGISRVRVKVDDGPWVDAAVGQPLSTLTWALWRYDWPFESGEHTFTVRAVDGFGEPQVEREQPPEPDGATGLYRVKKRV